MSDPLSIRTGLPLPRPPASGQAEPGSASSAPGGDFASIIRQQLDEVSRAQNEADTSVQQLVSGQDQNVTDVFVAARKAEIAFSLLMEIRNKLVDAYQSLQDMRV